EVEPRVFDVTPLGRLIATDAPGSLRFLSVMFAEQTDPLFDHIIESVRTGEPAAERVFGKPYFDWHAENPEASEIFNKAMAGGPPSRLPALLHPDFWPGEKLVVDVGGGNGTILTGLLREHPQLCGIVFDQPHLASEVDATIRAVGLADRCSFVGGNFFVEVPPNGDVYILAFILHDWGDEDAGRILTSCRRAVSAEGRLVLLEQIV